MAKLLAFAGSLREGSHNKKLLELEISIAKAAGAEVKHLDLADFELPLYNQDIQDNEGFPDAANALKAELEAADGFILAQPEYNYSTPGHLKNVFDWLSRYRPQPFRDLHGFLSSASPSMVGGNRGLWSTVQILMVLGVHVHPNLFSLARAHEAFDEQGSLVDEAMRDRLVSALNDYVALVDKTCA